MPPISLLANEMKNQMEFEKYKQWMESPNYSSLEELFELAELNQNEKDAFVRNKKYCEYWLLRSLSGDHKSFDKNSPNFIKRLARVINNLETDMVEGDKKNKIKELFGFGSPVRKVQKLKNSFNSSQNSPIVENIYFELLILSFFVSKGHKVKLISTKEKGKRTPEFIVYFGDDLIAVEAKNMNSDAIMNNIFGNPTIEGIDYEPSKQELQKGYERIKSQIEKRYEDAIDKYNHLECNVHYVIFMNIYFDNRFIGEPAISYLRSLQSLWVNENLHMLLGLVAPDNNNTGFIINNQCDNNVLNSFLGTGISEFHKYVP